MRARKRLVDAAIHVQARRLSGGDLLQFLESIFIWGLSFGLNAAATMCRTMGRSLGIAAPARR